MELAKYAALAVVEEGRSLRSVAISTGRSKSWVAKQAGRYRDGGEDALVAHKRGPRHAPNRTSPAQEDEIVAWRKRLDDENVDAGARTIQYHLKESGSPAPALATIHRVLVRRGFVTAEPQKRPRTSWIRFASELPNECWQSDMTHWHLANGTNVEIVNFIDDHSRAALSSTVLAVATHQRSPASLLGHRQGVRPPDQCAQRQWSDLHRRLPRQLHGPRARVERARDHL
ncbi:MAG TPA: helix-turn-helix domain-containing protein [Acidimicrobiales bacterium]|nr:helix-turn-helix domain-containing protein [Acidimicrobiales bacterium]